MAYRFIAAACTVLLGFTLAAPPALGQTATGTILGEIKDSTGGALPGVAVTAANQSNGATRDATTDARGGYSFSALPPGLYTIKAALSGFHEMQRTDVRLPITSQVEVPFVLEVGGVEETVTVSSVAPLVNSTEQAVRTNIETQQIAGLPLKRAATSSTSRSSRPAS